LKSMSEGNKIYHLSTGILQSLSEDAADAKSDKKWKNHLEKLQSMERYQPVVPSTLQANLREYQQEGFAYLSRLARWEIGACLADDMGLGKTVQAIALLLEQASLGPCLVVAPTSVCFNWIEELARFAPTINVHTLHTVTDRHSLVLSLDKMDVLICSYHLLHQTDDVLQKKWQIVVLDEAQAIKNSNTQRWKYVTQLKSFCRVALTGTPIENHLGELWSIFRFLNPGLLGSLTSFQQRYSGPIEKNRDPVAKRALKNIVHPYILRRIKSDVLQELPPKTETSILIEPTSEEIAFYEAVRQKALERIGQLNGSQAGNKRFSVLAEITRLRQACCHSSLVDENVNLESSKMKTFLEMVKNLIDNNHKVLVFSQYVRYLAKVKETLEVENISYQYLDGSTPAHARQAVIADFQAGKSDLFLISLKAGGTGLNLTAADYVIILDPWWNPAVEDQASDRAHRIGQQRPVTVYRLIMKNSIEEKIVKLHKDKRDLASDLLSGSDVSGKMTEEDLIQLIAT
jgi:SNF2 family DNA or RNA helicase